MSVEPMGGLLEEARASLNAAESLIAAGYYDSQFHRWLLDAQDLRNVADYGVEAQISKVQAETMCEQAREFIQAAEAYLSR